MALAQVPRQPTVLHKPGAAVKLGARVGAKVHGQVVLARLPQAVRVAERARRVVLATGGVPLKQVAEEVEQALK